MPDRLGKGVQVDVGKSASWANLQSTVGNLGQGSGSSNAGGSGSVGSQTGAGSSSSAPAKTGK